MLGVVLRYREEVVLYKEDHLRDRQLPQCYVQYMIAIINNCQTFRDSINKRTLNEVAKEGCQYLLDEVFLDLENHLNELLTRKWLSGSHAVDTICVTVEDYFNDFNKIKNPFNKAFPGQSRDIVPPVGLESSSGSSPGGTCSEHLISFVQEGTYFSCFTQRSDTVTSSLLILLRSTCQSHAPSFPHCEQDPEEMTGEALRRVVVEYLKAVMQKRITFKNADERRDGADRMIKEAEQFKFLFSKLAAGEDTDRLCGAITAIAEVFKLTDPTLLYLEEEHVQALLAVRGDASREMRQMIIGTLSENRAPPSVSLQPIFKDIPVPNMPCQP
ncbi:hypothetical protein WMY93_001035 [Mugilogobius chulae]|uniref:Exocyst complex component Sec6 n=1 Tax=Mugilogobius chulae TaxID=88201 RepID=A0AAW0Q3P0_9GOBI